MKNKGFTLIEILVIVAIIAVLSTIALASVRRMFIAFNEASARNTIRTIASACEQYASFHDGIYPDTEDKLTAVLPPYLVGAFLGKERHGYILYAYPDGSLTTERYHLKAKPVKTGITGKNCFYLHSDKSAAIISLPAVNESDCLPYPDPPPN